MLLKKITLKNFRNYREFVFTPALRSLVVGDNGKGKTNLLEAISLLFLSRSFRVSLPESLINDQTKPALISAHIWQEKKTNILQLILKSSSGKKQIFVDGKKSSSFFVSSRWPVVLFSPESLTFLKGSAQQRRDWLDLCLIQKGDSLAVRDFKRILKQKNQLLNQVKKSEISRAKAVDMLSSLNEIFSHKACNLVVARRAFLKEIEEFLLPMADILFNLKSLRKIRNGYFVKGLDSDRILIDRASSTIETMGEINMESEEDFLQKFQEKLDERLDLELINGVCLYGPHRDDFKLFFEGKQARYFCSQGQQRGLLLALKLAQIEWLKEKQSKSALLLLDDVFSEIDKHLLLNLLQFLERASVQMVLTSTKVPSCLDTQKFSVFYLKNV